MRASKANMSGRLLAIAAWSVFVSVAGLLFATDIRTDNHFQALYSFSSFQDGASPYASVLADSSDVLYGTTEGGGIINCGPYENGCGTVFLLKRSAVRGWQKTTLYRFTGASDGGFPHGALVMDKAGSLYGTTANGGDIADCTSPDGYDGCGVVFRLRRSSLGKWQYSVIYTFTGKDGRWPQAGLILDRNGNLYGTAMAGGKLDCNKGIGCGTVFELTRTKLGSWKQIVLHRFASGYDGYLPTGSLILDSAENLYGTTYSGGNGLPNCYAGQGCGTVFKLSRSPDGWKETLIHRFSDVSEGTFPAAALTMDAAGNLYGTTSQGSNGGVVFKLRRDPRDGWKYMVLHWLQGEDGQFSTSNLNFDDAGNLYGTTQSGGKYDQGTIFKLSPGIGGWTETVVHNFTGGADGQWPFSGLTPNENKGFYGTTTGGGSGHLGVVFESRP